MGTRAAYFGVFTALALIFSYIESLIPLPVGIPGAKLGLANLVIVVILYQRGGKEAFLLSVVRIVLSGFLFGNLFSILYAMAGGVLSLAVMMLARRDCGYSVVGISIFGGVFHNIGQLIMAALVTESISMFYYLPFLLAAGLVTGLLIGITAGGVLKRIGNLKG